MPDARSTEIVVLDDDLAIVAIPSAMRDLVGAVPAIGDHFLFSLDGRPTEWIATRLIRRMDGTIAVWLSRGDHDA